MCVCVCVCIGIGMGTMTMSHLSIYRGECSLYGISATHADHLSFTHVMQVIRKTISIVSLLFHSISLHAQAFSFFSLFLFIGMIGYFFVARYMLKWSTHGETGGHSTGVGSSQDADGPDDD